jgi:hypothetical protein
MSTQYADHGFVKLQRSETTEELLGDPIALHLLTVIAFRARFSDAPNLEGLVFGEALVGDFDACGMTRGEYRSALDRLQKWRLVEVRPNNKGTVARLLDSRVFSLVDERGPLKNGQRQGDRPGDVFLQNATSENQQSGGRVEKNDQQNGQLFSEAILQNATTSAAIEQPANNQRTTTNSERQKDRRTEERGRPTLAQWLAYAGEKNWPPADAENAFDHYEANGWRQARGNLIRDWKAAARTCQRRSRPALGGPPYAARVVDPPIRMILP